MTVDFDAGGESVIFGDEIWSNELNNFVTAAVVYDSEKLMSARSALVSLAGDDVMLDAAAVLANFEMMTRLSDGTGAKLGTKRSSDYKSLISVLGLQE